MAFCNDMKFTLRGNEICTATAGHEGDHQYVEHDCGQCGTQHGTCRHCGSTHGDTHSASCVHAHVHPAESACQCRCHARGELLLHDHACCSRCRTCDFRTRCACARCTPAKDPHAHVFITPKTCDCTGVPHCAICDGGLSICTVCGSQYGRPICAAAKPKPADAGRVRAPPRRSRTPVYIESGFVFRPYIPSPGR